MNWHHFLLSVAILYGIYYALNIIYDMLITRTSSTHTPQNLEITFPKEIIPTKVSLNNIDPVLSNQGRNEDRNNHALPSASLLSHGGVNMHELVTLMQQNIIQYSKAIPY